MQELMSKIVLIGKYKELLVPKHVLPLQIRFRPDNIIEYHIESTNPDLNKLKILLDKWFLDLVIQKIEDIN